MQSSISGSSIRRRDKRKNKKITIRSMLTRTTSAAIELRYD